MLGCRGCWRRQACATGLSPVGPPWADAEAAKPRGWFVGLRVTNALAGAVTWSCVLGARSGPGGRGRCRFSLFSFCPPPFPALLAVRVAGRPVRVSLHLACWYAISCGLCALQAWSGSPSGPRRLPLACVCARAPACFCAPPLSTGSAWHAHHAPFWGRALVGPFQVVRAPPRFSPRSRALPS